MNRDVETKCAPTLDFQFDEDWLARLIHTKSKVREGIEHIDVRDPLTQEAWRLVVSDSIASGQSLAHEYSLAQMLDESWADKPVAMILASGRTVLVLPEMVGQSVDALVRQDIASLGVFLKLAVSAASALSQMHAKGLIHARIRSRNILVMPDGRVIFSSFGSSVAMGKDGFQAPHAPTLSDMAYAAPEETRRDRPDRDQRSDVYSLGVVLYEVLTGELPLRAETMAQWLHAHIAVEARRPSDFRPVPRALEQIIMKLIAKDPELRYQTAHAVHADFRLCFDEWSDTQTIMPFALGRADVRQTMLTSDRLFGRSNALGKLVDAATRTAQSGTPEIVLIAGAPGAGKSALVNRLPKLVGKTSLLFAAGKSEQLLKDVPFAPFSQILTSLIVNVLSANSAVVQEVSERLSEKLTDHADLLLELVPEADYVLNPKYRPYEPQASVSEARMIRAIVQALTSFSTTESPLVLFLDDVQWADVSTVAVIKALMAQPIPYLLLIIAYRDEEISEGLVEILDGACSGRLPLTDIVLNPLTVQDTADLITSLLNDISVKDVAALAELVHNRTGGNAFYTNHFLRMLVEQSALKFDVERQRWTVDHQLVAQGGNVIDFLNHRLQALSPKQQFILRTLAVLGGHGELSLMSKICLLDMAELEQAVQPLFSSGFLLRRGTNLSISHDRVLEAAYRLTDKDDRPQEHSRIAKLLLEEPGESSVDKTFQIAHQIERAAMGDVALSDQDRLAFVRVLVSAARRARSTGAVKQSIDYLDIVRGLASADWDQLNRELLFEVEYLYCECLINAARVDEATDTMARLFALASRAIDKANVRRLQAVIDTVRSDYESAINDALEGLALLGITLRRRPSVSDCDTAYDKVRQMLEDRTLSAVIHLPEVTDPEIKAALALLSTLSSSFFVEGALAFTHLAKIVELSLIHGVAPETAYGLAWFGVFSASRYGIYSEAYDYATTAAELVQRSGFEAQRTGTLVALDQITPWTRPLQDALATAREAAKAGHAADDLGMTCYARNHIVSDLIAMGTHLTILKDEVEQGIALIREVNYQDIETILQSQSDLVHMLLQGNYARRQSVEATHIRSIPTQFWANFCDGMAAYFFCDDDAAVELLNRAMDFSWSLPAHIDFAYEHLFMALALARKAAKSGVTDDVLSKLEVHRRVFVQWAELNPATFANKLALIEAEIASLRGEFRLAAMGYERSVNLAEAAGFVHEQALGHELAGAFYELNGLRTAAKSHMHTAHTCYSLWGAEGKAQQVQSLYPEYFPKLLSVPSARLDSQAELDLDVVIRTSQALSEEIVLERVVGALMKDMIIHAGAQYGLLLMMHDEQPIIEASGRVVHHDVVLDIAQSLPQPQALPFWVLNAVVRKKKSMVFADAFAQAPQIRLDGPSDRILRSVLCLPLIKRGALVGIMYLENNLAPGVFSTNRVAMLEILAPQAAISLDAARLYRELSEENMRRAQTEADLMQARAELARTSQLTLMGGLAASIAHEINQPLASIVSNADASARWLKREKPNLDEAIAGLESIRESGIRAADIIKALRSLAKQGPAAVIDIDLNTIVKEVIRLTSPEIARNAIHVETIAASSQHIVRGDPVQLQQVILNLVTNAIDVMSDLPEGKRDVLIEVSTREGNISVHVKDKGRGIDSATLHRIFEPFFSTKAKGMGMGLAICQSILEAHGGRLQVSSVIGEGTTFFFSLPAIERAPVDCDEAIIAGI
jgi:predicted ATPase/signal transduction histidine kinase